MRFRSILFFAILALLVSSCVSFPANQGEGEGLVVIPIQGEKNTIYDSFGKYYAVIMDYDDDSYVTQVSIDISKDYAVVRNLDPGRYYIDYYYFKYDEGYTDLEGNTRSENYEMGKFETLFSVEPGVLTITDTYFYLELINQGSTRTIYVGCYTDSTGARRKEAYNLLLQKYPEQMSTWEILGFDS